MKTNLHPNPMRGRWRVAGRKAQRGAASLVELMIVLVLSGILSVYAVNAIQTEADEATAASTATYLVATTAAVQRYSLVNFTALQAATPVLTGFTNPNAPTMAELKNAGYLGANVNTQTPTRQGVRFDLVKTGTCPGNSCRITAMSCITDALKLRGKYRDDLATVAVSKMNGQGGRSYIGDGNWLRGAGGFQMVSNPIKTGIPAKGVEGVVCGQNVFDSAVYDQFVKMNETREVTLNNNLYLNSGTDSAGNPCRRVAINPANGQIETYLSGCDQTKPAVSILQEKIDGVDVGSIATRSPTDANKTSTWIRGDGTFWIFDTSGYKTAIKSDGTMFMNNEFKLNTTCNPNQEQALAWTHSAREDVWRLARCTNGKWRPDNGAVAGASCRASTPGATAVDSNTSAGLICTNGKWVKTTDRLGKYAIQKNVNAVNGNEVPKPVCDAVSTPVAVIMPTGLPPQNEVFVYLNLIDQGTYWLVSITDQTGAETDATVKLQLSCLYQ